MFWDNKDDPAWLQALKNQTFMKMPVSNKTRDEFLDSPAPLIIIGIMVVMVILFVVFGPAK